MSGQISFPPIDAIALFDELKTKSLTKFNAFSEKIQKLKFFTENHLNIKNDGNNNNNGSFMCSYLEKFHDLIVRFDSELDELDLSHIEIRAARKNVDKARCFLITGKRLISLEKFNDAIGLLTRAQFRLPYLIDLEKIEWLYNRAFAKSKVGALRSAISDCSKALTIDSSQVNVRLLRAELYQYLDRFLESVRDYEFACDLPNVKENQEKFEEVSSRLEKVKQQMNHKLAENSVISANEKFGERNFQAANDLFSKAIDLWPENILFYEKRYVCSIKRRNFRQAMMDCQRMIEIDSNWDVGMLAMVECSMIVGDYESAEQAIGKLLQNDFDENVCLEYEDKCTKLRYLKVSAEDYYHVKLYENAVEEVDNALDILPGGINFIILKAECFLQLSKAMEIEVIERTWNSLYADHDYDMDHNLHYIESLRCFAKGNILPALSKLKQILSDDPNHEKSKIFQTRLRSLLCKKVRSNVRFEKAEYQRAVDICTEALEDDLCIEAYAPEILCIRAKALSKIGYFRKAVEDCDKALNARENDVTLLILRAECYQNLDELIKSIADYETVLNMNTAQVNARMSANITAKMQGIKTSIQHQNAEKKVVDGDNYFQAKEYKQSLNSYDEAIHLWKENISFHGKRIECLMKMGEYKQAMYDCKTVLEIDPTFVRGYSYLIECCCTVGDVFGAEKAMRDCEQSGTREGISEDLEQNFSDLRKFRERMNESVRNNDYATAILTPENFLSIVTFIDNALEISYASVSLKVLKSECLALLERFEEANSLAISCTLVDPMNADAVYVRALCLYNRDCEQGLKCFKNVLTLDPDHKKAKTMISKVKKLEDNERKAITLLKEEKYREASECYSAALAVSPVNRKLTFLYFLALAKSKLGFSSIREAIKDCTKVMKSNLVSKALQLRGQCYMSLRNFRKGLDDFEALLRIEKSEEVKNMLEEAKVRLKRSQSDCHYDVMEVDRNATQADIKMAYRKLALIHHPDKYSDSTTEEVLEQQEILKKINVAYEILSDPQERAKYDEKSGRK